MDTDTLEIHDIFDPDLFEIVTTDSNSYNNAQFGAGDQYWDADNGANGSSNGGVITVTPTKTGATFSIKNVATKSGGAYYSWYSIRYYLKVKDAEALKKFSRQQQRIQIIPQRLEILQNGKVRVQLKSVRSIR